MSSASGEFSTIDDATLISGDSIMGEAVRLARLGPGKSLGRYIVLSRIAVGDAGVLYAAYDPRSEQRLALRLLRPVEGSEDTLLQAARALAAVRHPNLIRIHEVGVVHEVVYLATDYLGGGTLREWLDAERRSRAEILELMRAVGSGLAAAHRAGLVHRDLRPANVLLDDRGTPCVVDFGFGRRGPGSSGVAAKSPRRVEDSTSVDSLDTPLIRTGQWIGTPAYIAPEQYKGEPVDARADQFSFCVMLYEALYGQRPFEGRTIQALFLAVEEGRVRPAPRGSGVPGRLREIVVRGLAYDPAQRWPSMDALLEVLAAEPGRRRRRVYVGGALVVAIAAGVGALVHDGAQSPAAGAEVSSIDAELARASALLDAAEFERAREALAVLEPALEGEASASQRARHALLSARALGRSDDARAESLLLAALAHATKASDDPLSVEIARELGVRLELRRIEALTRGARIDEARDHLGRARALLEHQRDPDPTLDAALRRWEQTHP